METGASPFMMKKVLVLFAFFLLAGTTSSDGAFIIQLTDGGEYRTSRYWFEGSEIKFFVCGGILGVPRGDVQRITKSPANDGAAGERSTERDLCAPQPQFDEKIVEGELTPDEVDVSGAEDPPPSPTYIKYQKAVKEFEKKLDAISLMSPEDLMKLAVEGEALKEEIITAPEVPELRPLLPIVYRGLDEIEDALNGGAGKND